METQPPNGSNPQHLATELNSPPPPPDRRRAPLIALGRIAAWAVLTPPRRGLSLWSRLRPPQQLVLGFASYAVIGTALLCLPFAQRIHAPLLDNLFNATSALSTTGLTTISITDSYTPFGQVVLLILFQLGGLGYMTLSSVIVLARGKPLSESRLGILKAGFSVPHYFVLQRFIVHVIVYTAIVELLGTVILWWRFAALGVENPLWSALFHCISAFATAGFSLNNNSLESFAGDWPTNLTIGLLCYLGAIGFIVVQDAWYSFRFREHMLTFTSKVILASTALIFIAVTASLFFLEPAIRHLAITDRLLAAAFQAMTASSTAGFNSIPIGSMSAAALSILMLAMLIGASPSGTGGGIKTTSASALLAATASILRGRTSVTLLGHEVPLIRILSALAAATLYLVLLALGVIILCLTESKDFLQLAFEAASALGTVGLSMGITADLSTLGKLTIILLMFAGRCGPLTLGLALLRPDQPANTPRRDDLAV
jgi:trk system potassium uptake protein TrkH